MFKQSILGAAVLTLAVTLSACGKQDADQAAARSEQAAAEAKQESKEAAAAASVAADQAGQAAGQAADAAGAAANAAGAAAGEAVNAAGAAVAAAGTVAVEKTKEATAVVVDKVDDAAIHTAINAAYAADPELGVLKVDVDVKEGKVELHGSAPNEAARVRAGDIAKAVKGVTSVTNMVTVKQLKK